MKDFIVMADLFGVEGKLYVKDKNSRHKNLFGGVISMLTISLMLAGGLYFFEQFLKKSNFTIVFDQEMDLNTVYPKLNNIPLLMRVSGGQGKTIPFSFWRVSLSVLSFDASISSLQNSTSIPMVQCSENHLGNYSELFSNFSSIETYMCPDWGNTTFNLFGAYGLTKFSYFLAFIRGCNEKIGDKNCSSVENITNTLSSPYIDFATVDYQLSPFTEVPYSLYVNSQRFAVSNTVFKRIWISFGQITYSTDTGLIFEDTKSYTFNQIQGSTVDTDLRKTSDGSFVWLTLINTKYNLIYLRSYMKAQTLLANIGGIINGLSILATLVCFTISENLHNISLVNKIFNNKKVDKKNDYKIFNESFHHNKNPMIKLAQNTLENEVQDTKEKNNDLLMNNNATGSIAQNLNHVINNNFIGMLKKKQSDNQIQRNILKSNSLGSFDHNQVKQVQQFSYTNLEILFPKLFCSSMLKRKEFNKKMNLASKDLNVYNILTSVQEIEFLKNLMLDESQVSCFNSIFQKCSPLSKDFKLAYDSINEKEPKLNIDAKLLSAINNNLFLEA